MPIYFEPESISAQYICAQKKILVYLLDNAFRTIQIVRPETRTFFCKGQ